MRTSVALGTCTGAASLARQLGRIVAQAPLG
jgi:hypothetical protein